MLEFFIGLFLFCMLVNAILSLLEFFGGAK